MVRAPEPNPLKPTFAIVEDTLKVQTGDRELSLSLRVPMATLERLMEIEETDAPTLERYRVLVEEIMPDRVADLVRSLSDDASLQLAVAFKWSQALGVRLGKLNSSSIVGATTG